MSELTVPADHPPSATRLRVRLLAEFVVVGLVLLAAVDALIERWRRRITTRARDDRGQATTEYALVLLAAALVALLVVAWATAGGGAQRINRLFNRVVDSVVDRV